MASVDPEQESARKGGGLLNAAKKTFHQAGRSIKSKLLQRKRKKSRSRGLAPVPCFDERRDNRDTCAEAGPRSLTAEPVATFMNGAIRDGTAHTGSDSPSREERVSATVKNGSVSGVACKEAERGLRELQGEDDATATFSMIEVPVVRATPPETATPTHKGLKDVKSFRLNDLSEGAVLQDIGSFVLYDLHEEDEPHEIKSYKLRDLTKDYTLQEIGSYKLNDLDGGFIDEELNDIEEAGYEKPTVGKREVQSFRLEDMVADFDSDDLLKSIGKQKPNESSIQVHYPKCCSHDLCSYPVDLSSDN